MNRRFGYKLSLLEIMILIAGAAVGLWLFGPDIQEQQLSQQVILIPLAFLGGASVVGVPLLLLELPFRRRLWRAGKVIWFSQGMASWLLWPPMIVSRIHGKSALAANDAVTGICYFYGTPLMAIYISAALICGGWIRPRRKRRKPLSWRERFGVTLGALWSILGFYVLWILYTEDF